MCWTNIQPDCGYPVLANNRYPAQFYFVRYKDARFLVCSERSQKQMLKMINLCFSGKWFTDLSVTTQICNQIEVIDSLDVLELQAISSLYVDQFGRSLWFWNLMRRPFRMVAGVKMPGIAGVFRILSDILRQLSFCGPCFWLLSCGEHLAFILFFIFLYYSLFLNLTTSAPYCQLF